MTNCRKLLKNSFLFLILLLSFTFIKCSKEEKEAKSVVKVNNSVLTEEDIERALSSSNNFGKFREEFIQNWIETEILYDEAVDDGILDDKEFKSIIEQSKKKLAASMYLDKILSDKVKEPTNDELLDYYETKQEDFRLTDESFRINIAEFNNFDKAVRFRTMLLESGWNRSASAFRDDVSLVFAYNDVVKSGYMLQPQILSKNLYNLMPGEVSIVLELEPSKFTVVQLVEKLGKGSVPPFEAIKEKLKRQYLVLKNKEFITDYINNLVEDHNVEIKRYKE
jgi:hypothetical protein